MKIAAWTASASKEGPHPDVYVCVDAPDSQVPPEAVKKELPPDGRQHMVYVSFSPDGKPNIVIV